VATVYLQTGDYSRSIDIIRPRLRSMVVVDEDRKTTFGLGRSVVPCIRLGASWPPLRAR
jgi:hypothetical protein